MRTLHADLTAAQVSASAAIYDQIVLTQPSPGTDVRTYTTADATNRIFGIEQTEKQYGGRAVILLDNSDGFFNSANLTGYRVQIGWGYVCTGPVNRYSNTQYMWVVSQTEISRYGRLLTQLVCLDIWGMIENDTVFSGCTILTGTVTKDATYNPIGRVILGGSTGAHGTVTHCRSDQIVVSNVVGTFGSGETATIGSDLSMAVVTATVFSAVAGGAKQWGGDTHIEDIISSLLSAWVAAPTIDSDDTGSNYATYMPVYSAWIDARLSIIIQEILDFTQCGMRMRDGTMHVLYLDPAPVAADYTYNGVHNISGCDRTRQLAFPNRIYVVDKDPYQSAPSYVGSYIDSTSYAALQKYINAMVIVPTVTSNAQAAAVAQALITRGQQSVSTGSVAVPMMNVGQEILDWVTLTDARNSDLAISGRVGTITRKLENGQNTMTIELGGLKLPNNFRAYPSPQPTPYIGPTDIVQSLILATTIWAGYGKVKLDSNGVGIVGDSESTDDAMLKFASTSEGLASATCYIWHNEGELGITADAGITLATGGNITLTSVGVTYAKLASTQSSHEDHTSGTVYQNTSGKLKMVTVSWGLSTGAIQIDAYCDANNPPTTLVALDTSPGASFYGSVTFMVPVDYYYKVVASSTPDQKKWTEWTIG